MLLLAAIINKKSKIMKTKTRLLQAGISLRKCAERLRAAPQARLVLLATLTALTLGGGTKGPKGGSELLVRVGSWPGFTRRPAMSVALADHYAYVAMGEGGLAILDVSDPAQPRFPVAPVTNIRFISQSRA